jgi:hypothetical protein
MLPRRALLLPVAAGLVAPVAAASQPRGRIHALCIGINAYTGAGVRPLRGCVNDVRIMREALEGLAASVATLTDAAATRDAALARWREVVGRAVPGDTLIFHFAGHGARDPRWRDRDPADTTGDFLLFQGYDPVRAPREILLDRELHALLLEQHRRGVQPIVLLDCCHAGALTRSADPRASVGETYRTPGLSNADIVAGMARLGPPPPRSAPAALEPILFLAAGQDIEVVPEVRLPDGNFHGALSVGFARAVSGAADRDRDGVLTRGELFDHILIASRSLAESRQTPVMQPAGRLAEPILPVARAGIAARAPDPARLPQPDPVLRLAVLNLPPADAAALARSLPQTRAVASGETWDILWDAATGDAFGPARDLLSAGIGQAELLGVLLRQWAQRRLTTLSLASGLDFGLVWPNAASAADSNASHPEGRRLVLRSAQRRLPHLVVFNLAGNGTVQLLHPSPRGASAVAPRLEFCVRAPFGADLVVALAADRPLDTLAEALRRENGRRDATALLGPLEAALTGADWQIGMQTVVTRPNRGEVREC